MKRICVVPRADWAQKVESQGFLFHTADEGPYWDESGCYEFTRREVDELERATYELDRMCLAAVQHVLDNNLWERLGIPREFVPWVARSWERDEHTIYGRFDLAYDGRHPPKLLEYNADTPTSLLEAAVVQWFWLEDYKVTGAGLALDQFNSIHERLIDAWKTLPTPPPALHFTAMEDVMEDYITVSYLRDTAMQAGLQTEFIPIADIGWNGGDGKFTDLNDRAIATLFKLYPWEWLLREEFGRNIPLCPSTQWLEPPWKMLLSNKAILPVLGELFPSSPYLLRASDKPFGNSYVCKPVLGREGANIQVVRGGEVEVFTDGDYGDGPFVYQELAELHDFDGNHPVIGSWMVNGYACGIGIREDTFPVTSNTSRFVPHYFTA